VFPGIGLDPAIQNGMASWPKREAGAGEHRSRMLGELERFVTVPVETPASAAAAVQECPLE